MTRRHFFLISVLFHLPLLALYNQSLPEGAEEGQSFTVVTAPSQEKGRFSAPSRQAGKGGTMTPPKVISRPQIAYPEYARSRGIEGKVEAFLQVSTEGKVEAVDIIRADHDSFREPALQGLQNLTFTPAKADGLLIPVRIKYIYTFVLQR
jgi:TonB family protein